MAKKQFKAESKKLLDLMINSIYTHKEIFLRELISNASDALDKMYYNKLLSENSGVKKNDFYIEISLDKELKTITIKDNGIGMDKSELENNLGTIAKSGSQSFKSEVLDSEDKNASKLDIIGQFGVGFYSAFMVSDLVTVSSKQQGASNAYIWKSSGADGYSIEETLKEECGTEIVLHIKDDSNNENYSHFLEEYTIKNLIKKYSDYIRYPIKMSEETLNSMEPIWKRRKSNVKTEDYNEYYKSKFMAFEDPARIIRTSIEGVSSFTALLFIPSNTPYDYYTKSYEKGLQLYSSGVMIMEKCAELLPDYFNFVKGVVDSQDLSLNISREMLQHDRQLKNIAKNIEKKIKRDLLDFLKNDRENYEKFFAKFGKQIKFGIYDNFGANKDALEDLLVFHSSESKKNVTLAEYKENMKDGQDAIYYAAGESIDKIDMLPQTENVKSKGYEILYLTDEIDEFVMGVLREYNEIPLRSVSSAHTDDETSSEEHESIKSLTEENSALLSAIKNALDGKVSDVRLSPRLKKSAFCLTTKGDLSLEMEKVLNSMPFEQQVKSERVLEINPEHKLFKTLQENFSEDEAGKEFISKYAKLIYDQSLLISGITIDNPVEFSNLICDLMTK